MKKTNSAAMEDLTGTYDPTFAHLQGSEDATREEEGLLAAVLDVVMSRLYSEEGMAKIANVLQQDKRPLMQKIPEILTPLLLSSKGIVEKEIKGPLPSSVFFGDGGAMQTGVDLLFDLAQQLKVPGAEDQDQYAGAVIGMYKAAGEHVLETGDKQAVAEAASLAQDMVLTQPDGEMMDPDQFKKKYADEDSMALEQEIQSALGTGAMGRGGML